MALEWNISFHRIPNDLDSFLESQGFVYSELYDHEHVYSYVRGDTPRNMTLYYAERHWLRGVFSRTKAQALLTITSPATSKNLRTLYEQYKDQVQTEHDYYRFVDTDSLRWFELGLTIRDYYRANIISNGHVELTSKIRQSK